MKLQPILISLMFMGMSMNALAQSLPNVQKSLVPTTPSQAPDYYCTWNLQGYVCSYGSGSGSNDMRIEINEDNLFGDQYGYKVWGKNTQKAVYNNTGQGKSGESKTTWSVPTRYQGWLNHFPMIRQDLTFVMDDSWDIPKGKLDNNGVCNYMGSSKRPNGTNYDNPYMGTLVLNAERFPSFSGTDVQRMKGLADAVKAKGWRMLGGWVCAQDPINLTRTYARKSNTLANSLTWTVSQEETYWKQRMQEAVQAGVGYWKVDWGNKDRNDDFRKNLSKWGREVAPSLIIEHASFQDGGTHKPQYITFSQTIRSYDVNNNIAQAQTIQRMNELGQQNDAEIDGWGIINCEDEPYIAAGLGCAIGVMRHPYVGNMPNGKQDTYFADYGNGSRRLKNRLNEIVRAVRWHRIALPFGHKKSQWKASSETLSENGNGNSASAPARMSRRLPLPTITGSGASNANRPYVLASLYDNDCAALAIINRNINGVYQSQRVDVSFEPLRWDCKVGIFGLANSVTLRYQGGLPSGSFSVYAQDLASDDAPVSIAYTKTSDGNGITISGSVIDQLCKGHDYPYSEVQKESGKDYTDLSDPAIVLLVVAGGQESAGSNPVEAYPDQFYLYNVGAKQWIKTGGKSKNPDSPALAAENERTANVIVKQTDGTYTIADPEFAPQAWGVQGRNTIYESNNGATSTNSWGTTLIPGWKFVSTGDNDGSVYIEYTWGEWKKGSYNLDDPSGKTYALFYGDWALGTNGWGKDTDLVKVKGVYSDFKENIQSHGNYAKWLIVPVGTGHVDVENVGNTGNEDSGSTSVTVNIPSMGQTTYSSAYTLDFTDSEVEAYIASGFNSENDDIVLHRVYVVPAGTGVLLKGRQGDAQIPVLDKVTWAYGNMFVAVVDPREVKASEGDYVNYYLSGTGGNGAGFYRVNGSMVMDANRAYLRVPANIFASEAARVINYVFEDETTGIETVGQQEDPADNRFYDLHGRQVKNPKKGIYLNGRHKMIVR